MSRRTRLGLIVAGLLLGLVLVARLGSGGSPDPQERPGASSSDGGPSGLTVLRDLLLKTGHHVDSLRETPSRADLDPASTVILLDPGPIDPAETAALASFVDAGGRLVFGGDTSLTAYTELAETSIDHQTTGPRDATPIVPSAETVGLSEVRLYGGGSFAATGRALPLIAGPRGEGVLATLYPGRGTMVLLADASPLQNALIGDLDNAQLGLDLAGDRDRPVLFAERVRLSASSGLAALPTRWRVAFLGLVLAGLLLIASRIRRTGPPEEPSRPLAPPRRRYVDAVATALARTGEPSAAEPLRFAARRRLLAASPEGLDAGPEELARAGAAAGLEPAEWEALAVAPKDEKQMLAIGAALAKLKEVRR